MAKSRILAYVYLQSEAEVSQEQAMMPTGDRVKLLRQLGNALRDARRKADEAMKTVRGPWFVGMGRSEWQSRFHGPHHRPL